jgi:peptide/nickel transport system permease protein
VRGYLIRRLLWMAPTFLGITLAIFLLMHAAPGDPASIHFLRADPGSSSPQASDREIERFNSRHGFNQPLWRQYLSYLGPFSFRDDGHRWFGGSGERPYAGLLALDLGRELDRPSVSVGAELLRRMRVTLPLAICAILLSYAVALPLGILSAARKGTRLDRGLTLGLFCLYSVPSFWGGLMLIRGLGPQGLDWLPALGLHGKEIETMGPLQRLLDLAAHSILPLITLSYGTMAYLARHTRMGMVEQLGADYVRTARAKGLAERTVLMKHALRNAALPILTLFGSMLPVLIGGSIIVESVFDLPGMGRYAFEGLLRRDYNIVMATTTFSALVTMAGILIADVSYTLVDPRIRLA